MEIALLQPENFKHNNNNIQTPKVQAQNESIIGVLQLLVHIILKILRFLYVLVHVIARVLHA